jgi:hypothetical protein
MLPPVETNFDIVVQNNVTPSAAGFNLGQSGLRYQDVWTENVACNAIGFHSEGELNGTYFTGSCNELRDKPDFSSSQPEFYESLTFFPDKSLTLTAEKTA